MQKESFRIIENLGYPQEFINILNKENKEGLQPKTITYFKNLGIPDAAIKQIKNIEIRAAKTRLKRDQKKRNKELIDELVKKCKRSLDAFARKSVPARVVFAKKDWVIEAPEYHPAIQHLHEVCSPHFDNYAEKGLIVIFQFTGNENWQIITKVKEEDTQSE